MHKKQPPGYSEWPVAGLRHTSPLGSDQHAGTFGCPLRLASPVYQEIPLEQMAPAGCKGNGARRIWQAFTVNSPRSDAASRQPWLSKPRDAVRVRIPQTFVSHKPKSEAVER